VLPGVESGVVMIYNTAVELVGIDREALVIDTGKEK